MEELDKWAKYGVEGHFKTERPWVTVDEVVEKQAAAVLGASTTEVVVMNTLTTNLHLLMVSFYRPTTERYKIIMEAKAFPSDAVSLAFHCLDVTNPSLFLVFAFVLVPLILLLCSWVFRLDPSMIVYTS